MSKHLIAQKFILMLFFPLREAILLCISNDFNDFNDCSSSAQLDLSATLYLIAVSLALFSNHVFFFQFFYKCQCMCMLNILR